MFSPPSPHRSILCWPVMSLDVRFLVAVVGMWVKVAAVSFTPVSSTVVKGFVYSSFLKPYNPRRSQSDVSIESQSSNESGYGGSSPVFSRQNSNSTLTFNQETATVSFCASQPPSQSSPHPSLDSASSSSRRSHPRDAPTQPEPPGQGDSIESSQRNASSRREFSEATHRNAAGGHRDPEASYRHHRDEAYDPAYTSPRGQRRSADPSPEPYSTHRSDRSQRYGHSDRGYSSPQWRNGENAALKQSATHSRDEVIEPEQESELDGQQVRPPAAHTHIHIKTPCLQAEKTSTFYLYLFKCPTGENKYVVIFATVVQFHHLRQNKRVQHKDILNNGTQ